MSLHDEIHEQPAAIARLLDLQTEPVRKVAARTLAWMAALIGQLFPAVMVAVTVAAGPVAPASADQTATSENTLPVRGFAIGAPAPDRMDDFIDFIDHVLVPSGVNTLVLRVDYNFEYRSHPELRDDEALSRKDMRKIRKACRRGGIRVVPQINLLGHQSWETKAVKLLEEYPEFDETPWIELPETYGWPNDDDLYCKSYCPLHPKVHEVVFALVDEIVDIFEADAFHAGMDEVFYIAMDRCPRCGGRDPAELFAGEVTLIRNHLARSGVELWIWGDRLIDGKTTGIGEWEASMNRTHRAIDLIPKDVVINDWHYERADPTAPYFRGQGFQGGHLPVEARRRRHHSNRRHVAVETDLNARNEVERFAGIMQTIWSPAGDFHRPVPGPYADAGKRAQGVIPSNAPGPSSTLSGSAGVTSDPPKGTYTLTPSRALVLRRATRLAMSCPRALRYVVRHESRHQDRQEELADEGLHPGQGAGRVGNRSDVAVAESRQGDEAVIGEDRQQAGLAGGRLDDRLVRDRKCGHGRIAVLQVGIQQREQNTDEDIGAQRAENPLDRCAISGRDISQNFPDQIGKKHRAQKQDGTILYRIVRPDRGHQTRDDRRTAEHKGHNHSPGVADGCDQRRKDQTRDHEIANVEESDEIGR